MLKKSKYVIIIICMILIVGISVLLTGVVASNSYDIEEIVYVSTPSETEEQASMTANDNYVDDSLIRIPEKGNIPDEEYSVVVSLAVLLNSPMSSVIESASYEVKKIGDDFVVRFYIRGFELYVSCDSTHFMPYKYTCSRPFTDEERKFFFRLGTATEVTNEDGTYTLYFV